MRNRYALGSTPRLTLDVIVSGVGIISLSPTVAIKRLADGKWFQASDGTWKTNPVANAMTQTDSTNLPGRYHFDFDQSLDTLTSSTAYLARKVSVSTPVTEYEDLDFGPMASVSAPDTCSVQGTVFTGQGEPMRGAVVRATLQPILTTGLGRAVDSAKIVMSYTDEVGAFDLPLVRGGTFRLEVPTVGFDRKVTIPDLATVLFTEL